MATQQEKLPCDRGGDQETPWGAAAPHEAERSHLVQANLRAKALMAAELTGQGMGRESVARLLHLSPAELEDLLVAGRQRRARHGY